ncbi:hypothetical protein DFJ69_6069 [Thermomonospora umbrina]|uniref:Uncharacterized protein n=1 Tax=Thermomonospora umbrina TaxID=111806 RepID=A0A3D9T2D7_9ACTN|nr:hypothetical protein DFJ69_6069 [Thermomonospora umbrina]
MNARRRRRAVAPRRGQDESAAGVTQRSAGSAHASRPLRTPLAPFTGVHRTRRAPDVDLSAATEPNNSITHDRSVSPVRSAICRTLRGFPRAARRPCVDPQIPSPLQNLSGCGALLRRQDRACSARPPGHPVHRIQSRRAAAGPGRRSRSRTVPVSSHRTPTDSSGLSKSAVRRAAVDVICAVAVVATVAAASEISRHGRSIGGNGGNGGNGGQDCRWACSIGLRPETVRPPEEPAKVERTRWGLGDTPRSSRIGCPFHGNAA